MQDHLSRAVERRKVLVEVIFFLAGATGGSRPDLHGIDGHLQVNDAHRQGSGYGYSEEQDRHRVSGTVYHRKQVDYAKIIPFMRLRIT